MARELSSCDVEVKFQRLSLVQGMRSWIHLFSSLPSTFFSQTHPSLLYISFPSFDNPFLHNMATNEEKIKIASGFIKAAPPGSVPAHHHSHLQKKNKVHPTDLWGSNLLVHSLGEINDVFNGKFIIYKTGVRFGTHFLFDLTDRLWRTLELTLEGRANLFFCSFYSYWE